MSDRESFLKSAIKSVPVLRTIARRAYLWTFGSGGLLDQLRYVRWSVIGDGWYRTTIGDDTILFRCDSVPEARRASVAVQRERRVIDQLKALCEPGMVAFDVGANMGTHGIPLGNVVGETGTVVCFEPHQKTFDALVENIERNDAERVLAERLALGVTGGNAELYVEEDEPGVGSHSLVRRTTAIQTTEKVEVMPGDEYVKANDLVPDLIKIDVEGGELDVLRGFTWTLSEHKPALIVEMHRGVRTGEVRGLLVKHGYSLTPSTDDKEIFVAK